mgnify:CR=1 FL=1
MGPEGLQGLLAGDLLPILAGGQNGNDMPVGHRSMYQNAGGLHVGHDGHQIRQHRGERERYHVRDQYSPGERDDSRDDGCYSGGDGDAAHSGDWEFYKYQSG